jgi:hypothetical protein
MVEARVVPTLGCVAVPAGFAALTAVRVVRLMAVDALAARVLEHLIDVAARAGLLGVAAEQRKSGFALVVEAGFLPAARDVALTAFRAQVPVVGVVVLMTAVAGAGSVAKLLSGLVAGVAGGSHVGAVEGEVRLRVVEGLRNEPGDVRVASLMLRVAAAALAGGDVRMPAVESFRRCNVCRHVLVTLETELGLVGAAERRVAGLTFVLDVGVPFDHRPWHHQRLQRRGVHHRADPEPGEQSEQPADAAEVPFRSMPCILQHPPHPLSTCARRPRA